MRIPTRTHRGRVEEAFFAQLALVEQIFGPTAQRTAQPFRQRAREALLRTIDEFGRGTIVFTNASASLKSFANSGAFAMTCHAKTGLAESMARELMPDGIHVVNVPIDAAIGWTQEDGTRAHRLAGTTVDDNMADPDYIAHVSAIAPAAPLDRGVRGGTATVGREVVKRRAR